MEILYPQEHSYFNALLEAFPDAIVIVDAQGLIQHTNSQTELLFGYKKNELAGKAVELLIPAALHQTHITHRENFSKNSHVETIITGSSLEVIKKDGTKFSVEISLSPLKTDEGNFILASIRDTTTHKFAEEKLIQLSLAVEQSPASVIITDTKGNIQYANKKFMDVTGYGPEEVLGKNPSILKSGHTSETEYAELWKCIASGQEWQGEFHNKKKNGELYWEKALVSPILDAKGKIINFLAIKEDISEQKKAEKELTEKEFFLRESQKAGKIGSYKTNFVTGYWQSSETLDSIFGIDENFDRSLAGWLEIIHPDDRQKMEEYLRLEVIGKRKAFNKEYRIKAINDKQTKWLLGLGEVIIDDSGNVTGLIGTIQDVTERKNVEELLRQSEMNLRTIFDNTNTGFYLLDIEGNIISFNKMVNQFAKLSFGFELQEKKNLIMMMSPDRRQQFFDIRSEILSGSNFNYEVNYPHLDGSIIWYSINASQVCDSYGKVIGVSVAVNDITEKKKAEDKIRESEETFRRVFNESADPILLLDDTGFIECNKAASSILGYSSQKDVLIKQPWEISPEKQPDGRFSKEKAVEMISIAQQIGFNHFEWVHTKTDGTEFPVDVMATKIILKGKQIFYTLWRDISERKKAEKELIEINERYEFVNKATQDTIWEWDYRTHKGKWGEGIITTFGYTKDRQNYAEHWHNEFVHPLDKEGVRKTLEICHRERKDNWQYEYRFRCADGSYKNVYDRGFILYDNQGNHYRMIGAMTDVTEKKKLERKLVQQEIKHQKLITEVAIESQEKEKNELGKELHDNINQILATVKMYLGMVKLKEENSFELVEKSFEHVTLAMDEIRKLSHSLVPPYLGDIGLKDALKELINEMNISNKMQVKLSDEIDSDMHFDKKMELMIYRIIQEQMNNIFKYSGATKVLISLKKDNNTFFLSVSDNGAGFDTTRTSKGIGLKNIQSRVDFYTGNMKIISAPGHGCTLEINFPINNQTEPA